MRDPSTFVVTGADGFVGTAVVQEIRRSCAGAEAVVVASPRRGGPDLRSAEAASWLDDHVSDPTNAVLIHAAAVVDFAGAPGLLDNASMAVQTAGWARDRGVPFSVLVSSVGVAPVLTVVTRETPPHPQTLYGLGKFTAEETWRIMLGGQRHAVVRLAGVWGWQRVPTLFWNRLLLAAGGWGDGARLVVKASRRNCIPVADAARCIVGVARERLTDTFIAAGRDAVHSADYVERLQALPGSRLRAQVDSGKSTDEYVCAASGALHQWLTPFEEALRALWSEMPDWSGRA